MYDVSQPATLEKVHSWVDELQAHASGSASGADELLLVVAGNKSDLRQDNNNQTEYVDQQEANNYAETISH